MTRHKLFPLFSLILAAWLAGCSGRSGPRQIAAYPQDSPRFPLQAETVVVYNASLELEVADAADAAGQAASLVEALGGSASRPAFWIQDGWTYACLELAVPAGRFDDLRRGLYRLGVRVDEGGSGWVEDPLAVYPPPFSHLSLQLRSRSDSGPFVMQPGRWDPARTLGRALRVTAGIFHFLVDLLIWVLVVAGPFMLLAWGARALAVRLRKP